MSDDEEMTGEEDGAARFADAAHNGISAEARLALVEVERDEMKDRMLRIAAEFENWKKRARKEQEDGEAKIRESVLRDLLDVVDNLERAVGAYGQVGNKGNEAGAAAPAVAVDGAAVLKGVGLVLRVAQTKLDRHGVSPIVAHGQPFDPRLHEAISRIETADHPAGHVAVELQRGYRIGDRLLRPSLVGVATAPARPVGTRDSRDGSGGGIGGGSGDLDQPGDGVPPDHGVEDDGV